MLLNLGGPIPQNRRALPAQRVRHMVDGLRAAHRIPHAFMRHHRTPTRYAYHLPISSCAGHYGPAFRWHPHPNTTTGMPACRRYAALPGRRSRMRGCTLAFCCGIPSCPAPLPTAPAP